MWVSAGQGLQGVFMGLWYTNLGVTCVRLFGVGKRG